MSDGPHRSLDMRSGWKRVAECADFEAFAPDDVRDALLNAIKQDWREEVSPSFFKEIRGILQDNQSSLFGNPIVERLETLRTETTGLPLAGTFLDCAIHVASNGQTGNEAVTEAVSTASMDRAARGIRQAEEHYRRESTDNHATNVRERMMDGRARLNFNEIADALSGMTKRAKTSTKQTGLEDGVSLR